MLLHFDGFDQYATPGSTNRANVLLGVYGTSGSPTIRDMPEIGTYCLRGSSAYVSSVGSIRWYFPDGNKTNRVFGFGFHLYQTAQHSYTRIITILSTDLTYRYSVALISGVLTLYSGTSTIIGSAAGFNLNQLYHIETKIVQHSSAGSIEIRVNGATAILVTGINTSATIGCLGFCASTAASASSDIVNIDNLYVWDNTGDENNDWLGERLVYTLMPDGDGATQDWTLSTGSDTYALLDNIPSNPDNQYIESSAVDDIAQVTMSDLPSMDIIPIGVKVLFRGMKTGTSSIKVGVAPSGKTPVGHPLTQDQSLYFGNIYETNPDTGQPWTPSEINALTLDIKRVL